jgi:hypothetical protein
VALILPPLLLLLLLLLLLMLDLGRVLPPGCCCAAAGGQGWHLWESANHGVPLRLVPPCRHMHGVFAYSWHRQGWGGAVEGPHTLCIPHVGRELSIVLLQLPPCLLLVCEPGAQPQVLFMECSQLVKQALLTLQGAGTTTAVSDGS